MSDTSQGEGWWLASDGKWYPPELAPGAAPPPPPTGPPPTGPGLDGAKETEPQQGQRGDKASGRAVGLALAGGATMLGSVLPWAEVSVLFGTASINGTEGDGVLTLILGGVIVLTALLARGSEKRRGKMVLSLLCAVSVLVIAIFDIVDVDNFADEAEATGFATASVGIGLWITAVAGGLAALLSLGVMSSKPPGAGKAPAPAES